MFRIKLVSRRSKKKKCVCGGGGGGSAELSEARDSQPEPLPLLKPMPFSFSTHRSKGHRSRGKISVIGHRPVVSAVEDTVKLRCVI